MYQPVGDAVRIQQSDSVLLRNNIFWVDAGYDIYVTNDSQTGFESDYNTLFTTGTGKAGGMGDRFGGAAIYGPGGLAV